MLRSVVLFSLQHPKHGSHGLSSLVVADGLGVLVDGDHSGLPVDIPYAEPPAYKTALILQYQDVFTRVYPRGCLTSDLAGGFFVGLPYHHARREPVEGRDEAQSATLATTTSSGEG